MPRLNSTLHPYPGRSKSYTVSPHLKAIILKMMPHIAIIVGLASTALAANCGNGPYAPCVTVHKGTGCQSFNKLTSYRPTCQGNCYVYPVSLNTHHLYRFVANLPQFDSLALAGSAFKNVNCVAYSDTNCTFTKFFYSSLVKLTSKGKNRIGTTGNVSGGCYSFKGGNSMQCYHNC